MLKTIIILPDGTEISSGAGNLNAIQKSTIVECVNSGEELILGSTCSNSFEATLFTPNGDFSITTGSEIRVVKEDENGKRWDVGVFVMEKPTRLTANTMKLVGYDNISKLDKDLTAWLSGLTGWPYTLNSFASAVCSACGLNFVANNVPNKDYKIQKFSRTSVTGRQLMQWLGEICGSFCRANSTGSVEFAWYTPANVEISAGGDFYYFANGLSYEDYSVSPVGAVQVRLADSESGALWPSVASGTNSYIISGNPMLVQTLNESVLQPALNNILSRIQSATYTPCKVEVPATMNVHAGNTIRITDKNGVSITTYIMTKTQTGQKDTLECTGSARRDSSSAVNNASQAEKNAAMEGYASAAANRAVEAQTGEEIFNKLTNNGQVQGIYQQDGKWYINGEYAVIQNLVANSIVSGLLKSKDGKSFYLDLDNGILKMQASEFYVSGKTVDEISEGKAASAVNSQTAEDIFNKLTNNGEIKGLFVEDNVWVLNADVAKIINLIAEKIKSVDGENTLRVDGSQVTMLSSGKETMWIGNWGDRAYIYFTAYDPESGAEIARGQYGATRMQIGGTWAEPVLMFEVRDNVPYLHIGDDMKRISWKNNGDGTYSLVGTYS